MLISVTSLGANPAPSGPRTRPVNAAVTALAARHHSIVGRDELRRMQLSDRAIRRRVREGWLWEPFPGAYAIAGAALTRRGFWWAAAISVDGVLSHRSAAQLLALIELIPGPPHVTIAHGRSADPPGIVVHRSRALPPEQVTMHHGIPVTTPERTLLDFAGVATPAELRDAVAAAQRLELLDVVLALRICAAGRGRRGTGRLMALLRERRGPVSATRSPLEDLFLPICAGFGIRFPAVNVPLLGYEVDCLWLPEGLVVELDGYEWHRGRPSFEADRRRDARLAAAGHPVLRFTERRLLRERREVAAEVSATLARLRPERRTGARGAREVAASPHLP